MDSASEVPDNSSVNVNPQLAATSNASIQLRFDSLCASLPFTGLLYPYWPVERLFSFNHRTYSLLGQPGSTFCVSSHSPKHLKPACGQLPTPFGSFTPPRPNLYCR